MGGRCRTQTREDKGHQPSLPHYLKMHSTRATASHLMAAQSAIWFPTAGELWALPGGQGQAQAGGRGHEAAGERLTLFSAPKAPPVSSHQKLWFCLFSSFCPQGSCPEGETKGLLPERAEQLGLGDGRTNANQRQCPGRGPKPHKSQSHWQE